MNFKVTPTKKSWIIWTDNLDQRPLAFKKVVFVKSNTILERIFVDQQNFEEFLKNNFKGHLTKNINACKDFLGLPGQKLLVLFKEMFKGRPDQKLRIF